MVQGMWRVMGGSHISISEVSILEFISEGCINAAITHLF
jgi:hypothetical protein